MGTAGQILQAEIYVPLSFADMVERDWGVLFVTPTIPDSYDGNHACVLHGGTDLSAVVAEIVAFYERHKIGPRVYYTSAGGDNADLRQALGLAGFTLSQNQPMRVYLYRGRSGILPNANIRVRIVGNVDAAMLTELTSIENLRMAMVLQRRVSRDDAWLFIGEIEGEVAAVALLERGGDISRVDEVHTAERHRGKGLARAVIHALVTHHEQYVGGPLYLWTDNPIAERIYVEAGFCKLEHSFVHWSAWREL